MATLILSAVGTAVGGPIGSAVGTLIGRAIDQAVIGKPSREGPRLTELAVTTSSYGQPVPRVFGTMRMPGTIIWSTDLVESSETSGGKGKPDTTTYSYSISFAVALSSRPLASIGRIWADGALLRGASGDLKVGGAMRLYEGFGDQPLDPLIAADQGAHACAFRGLSYVVFEDLALASFGNRIPALSFEVISPDGALDVVDMLSGIEWVEGSGVALSGLAGFADRGGSRAALLQEIMQAFPMNIVGTANGMRIEPAGFSEPVALPEAIVGRADGDSESRPTMRRNPGDRRQPIALRYYDPARDYQPSLQHAPGASGAVGETIEFAGVFDAADAKARIAGLRRRALTSRETLTIRIGDPDSKYMPGACVSRPGHGDAWSVHGWEWHAEGIDLSLGRSIPDEAAVSVADSGDARAPLDELLGAITVRYFELPWDGSGFGHTPQRFAAVSMAGARSPLALAGAEGDALVGIGRSAPGTARQGTSVTALGPSNSLIFEPAATLDIALSSQSASLHSVDEAALLNGANRLRLGEEILQFRQATPLGGGNWRLTGLVRGRGATEHHAQVVHPAGSTAILLDDRLVALGESAFEEIAAFAGVGSDDPAFAALESEGDTLRPLTPVHCAVSQSDTGDHQWSWVRRARGMWRWLDGVDLPLVEEREEYRVGFGPTDSPIAQWQVSDPCLALPPATWSDLVAQYPEAQLWVRQIGTHAVSLPVALPHPS